MFNSILNATYILLGSKKAVSYSNDFMSSALRASTRTRPDVEAKPEVADLIQLGYLGLVLQELDVEIGFRKVKWPLRVATYAFQLDIQCTSAREIVQPAPI